MWRDQAKCRGMDLERFLLPAAPVGGRQREAFALCVDCPVIGECAADALTHGDIGVVRGGVWCTANGANQSPDTRRQLRLIATTF